MRRSSFLFRQKIRRCGFAHASLLLLLSSLLAILITPRGINSHEPITTKVMFNKEIVRIFQRHCLGCHSTESITDISLSTYTRARPWAKSFKEEVLEKRMPPFQAVKGFGRFQNDYTLTQQETDLIVSWVEGGAPKGDDKDLPAETSHSDGWILGQPDLVLEPKREATISSGTVDQYRCLAVQTNLKRTRWVKAVEFHSGNDAAVHCAAFAIEQSPVRKAAGDQEDCGAQSRVADERLGIWIPGQTVSRLPVDVARRLPARARIVLRIHYAKGSEQLSTRSSLGLYFSRGRAVKPLHTLVLAAPEQDIPVAESHRIKVSYTMTGAAEAIAIRPLLFPFAKSIEVTAHRPDGTIETLIWARDYHYDWQPEYRFRKPVLLPRGTRVELTAYLDNSDNNPNNPNNPARALQFASALCELSFIKVEGKTH